MDWVSEITGLAEFAVSQPQACYAAFTLGLKPASLDVLLKNVTGH